MADITQPTINIDIDSTLAGIPEIPGTITETSIHNTESVNLGNNREVDDYLKIDKGEKVNLEELLTKKTELKPTAVLDDTYFQNKRPISRQLSDKHDADIQNDLNNEIQRSYDTDVILARALNLEDEEREIADAQLRADITKEASERARIDSDLANSLAKYKYDMSQHVVTRELDVNGDTRFNVEVRDGDRHGGNVFIEEMLNLKDDTAAYHNFDDIIGTIKNALVKDFTQSYNATTGVLTSKLEFRNTWEDDADRPTVNTIEKSINLDIEKYIINIEDVYAIKNSDNTYTDQTNLTAAQLSEIESSSYTGNIKKYLKVTYNTRNNTNAGAESKIVYFEINEIFRSVIHKIESLDLAQVGSNGSYIKFVSQANGALSATKQAFDTSIGSTSTNNNAATSKAVYDFLVAHTHKVIIKDLGNNKIFEFTSFDPAKSNADEVITISNTGITLPTITVL